MSSSGPCLQNILHNNVAVNGGGRELGIQRRDTHVEIQAKRKYGKVQWMDDSGVILWIEALVDAKIANK
jgi:hypothetical protein